MPFDVKIIFTVAIVAVAVALAFVNADVDKAGPDWLWRGGRRDGFRRALCRPDGRLRSHTKLVLWLGLAAFGSGIWLFM